MKHKYGEFTDNQISIEKQLMRKKIFFLLLIVDPNTKSDYDDENINVEQVFDCTLRNFGGLNEVLLSPPELVRIISLLEAARIEYLSEDFEFGIYRKLILDAGSEVLKIKED